MAEKYFYIDVVDNRLHPVKGNEVVAGYANSNSDFIENKIVKSSDFFDNDSYGILDYNGKKYIISKYSRGVAMNGEPLDELKEIVLNYSRKVYLAKRGDDSLFFYNGFPVDGYDYGDGEPVHNVKNILKELSSRVYLLSDLNDSPFLFYDFNNWKFRERFDDGDERMTYKAQEAYDKIFNFNKNLKWCYHFSSDRNYFYLVDYDGVKIKVHSLHQKSGMLTMKKLDFNIKYIIIDEENENICQTSNIIFVDDDDNLHYVDNYGLRFKEEKRMFGSDSYGFLERKENIIYAKIFDITKYNIEYERFHRESSSISDAYCDSDWTGKDIKKLKREYKKNIEKCQAKHKKLADKIKKETKIIKRVPAFEIDEETKIIKNINKDFDFCYKYSNSVYSLIHKNCTFDSRDKKEND